MVWNLQMLDRDLRCQGSPPKISTKIFNKGGANTDTKCNRPVQNYKYGGTHNTPTTWYNLA